MLNSEYIELFESYLKNEKKASANTLSSYMRDIRQFSEYLESSGGSPIDQARTSWPNISIISGKTGIPLRRFRVISLR